MVLHKGKCALIFVVLALTLTPVFADGPDLEVNSDRASIKPTHLANLDYVTDYEVSERKRARTAIKKNKFYTRYGTLDLLFFVDLTQEESLSMAVVADRIYRALEGKRKFRFMGYTPRPLDPSQVENFRNMTKASFPIVDGADIARRLQFKRIPVIVIRSKELRRLHVEEGERSFFYLDELLKAITRR